MTAMLATKVSTMQWLNANRCVTQLIAVRNSSSKAPPNDRQTNKEHLFKVHQQLAESLPNFFTTTHCFNIYHQSLIFEDNIRHIKTKGLTNYIKRLNWIKVGGNLKYSHKEFTVLKITEHPEDMTVRIRWRIVGTPGLVRLIATFWRFSPLKRHQDKNLSPENTEWTDGFSIFYVGSDGLVHKHIAQKIIPDDERVQSDNKSNISGVKLALIVGLMPDLSSQSFESLFYKCLQNLIDLTTKIGSFGDQSDKRLHSIATQVQTICRRLCAGHQSVST